MHAWVEQEGFEVRMVESEICAELWFGGYPGGEVSGNRRLGFGRTEMVGEGAR